MGLSMKILNPALGSNNPSDIDFYLRLFLLRGLPKVRGLANERGDSDDRIYLIYLWSVLVLLRDDIVYYR